MSTNFPGSLDNGTSLPNPSTTSYEDTLSHAAQHANANDAIKAVETKLGTSASTPSSGLILLGTGAGSSSWSQLTSAQLFALLADKTGSGGSAVFNTSPTLITPKVDTINEATLNNGVTVAGMNIKAGVPTLPVGSVPASALGTGAITLGYAQIVANTSATTTITAISGLSTTVTIPAGGRRIKISAYIPYVSVSNAGFETLSIWDGAVGSGTQLNVCQVNVVSGSAGGQNMLVQAIVTPAAGSKTYGVGLQTSVGTVVVNCGPTFPAFISVEAI